MSGLKIALFCIAVLIALVISTILLLMVIALFPLIIVGLILIRIKLRKFLAGCVSDFKRAVFILLALSNYPLARLVRFLKDNNRIIIKGDFPKEKKKLLVVSNHPSWFDQITLFLIQLMSSDEWLKSLDLVPYIGAAKDSIKRLFVLRVFKTFCFVLPITRHITREGLEGAESEEEALKNILIEGNNLIISGPPGRDSKAKEGEIIFGPKKGKELRKFGGLCGKLAILPGVTTVPVFIEGMDKISSVRGGEIRFSLKNLLINFLLLGKFKIVIIFGESLTLEGLSQEEARQIIEGKVLDLSDLS